MASKRIRTKDPKDRREVLNHLSRHHDGQDSTDDDVDVGDENSGKNKMEIVSDFKGKKRIINKLFAAAAAFFNSDFNFLENK